MPGLAALYDPTKHHKAKSKSGFLSGPEQKNTHPIQHHGPQEIADPDIDEKRQLRPKFSKQQSEYDRENTQKKVITPIFKHTIANI